MLLLKRVQPFHKLRRGREFRRQAFFHGLGGTLTSGQKPVKFRRREIEVQRDLLELRTIHPAQHVDAGEPGDDGAYPVGQSAR
jgi:hypothetical protein